MKSNSERLEIMVNRLKRSSRRIKIMSRYHHIYGRYFWVRLPFTKWNTKWKWKIAEFQPI